MSPPRPPEIEVTAENIELCLAALADIIEADPANEIYMPLFERLERDLQKINSKRDRFAAVRERARQIKRQDAHTEPIL